MAIQSQLYTENPGFSMLGSQHMRLAMDSQQEAQDQQQFLVQLEIKNLQQQQGNKRIRFDSKNNNTTPYNTAHQTMTCDHNITSTSQVEKQGQEIDHYIKLQNERLRLILQEQRKQQFSMLLKKMDARMIELMRQKDEEIAQKAKRTMELENFLQKLEMENQTWKRAAQENEIMAVSLNNTLEEVRERACCINNGAEDSESCCDMGRENKEEVEKEKTGENRVMGMMACKVCNSRISCMLLLPCRHLCLCEGCEAYLDYCPVCKTAKKFSIEALI